MYNTQTSQTQYITHNQSIMTTSQLLSTSILIKIMQTHLLFICHYLSPAPFFLLPLHATQTTYVSQAPSPPFHSILPFTAVLARLDPEAKLKGTHKSSPRHIPLYPVERRRERASQNPPAARFPPTPACSPLSVSEHWNVATEKQHNVIGLHHWPAPKILF